MLTKEEADAIKVMISDWPSSDSGAFGANAAQILLEAIDRETETVMSPPPELNALILEPIVKDGKLTFIKLGIRDAPGFCATITTNAAVEIRDGFNYLLKITDWEAYAKEFGG